MARLGAVAPRHFCVAGVALGDIYLRFTWQEWCLATSTVVSRGKCGTCDTYLVSRGRRGTYGTGFALVARLGAVARRRFFAWQVWHLVTSAFVSRGRCGAWRHLPSFHVAGVALGEIYLRFTWQG